MSPVFVLGALLVTANLRSALTLHAAIANAGGGGSGLQVGSLPSGPSRSVDGRRNAYRVELAFANFGKKSELSVEIGCSCCN